MFFCSVRMRSNFSPARNVLSTTEPVSIPFSFVRTKAPPLPGLTCWNSTMRQTSPSSAMCIPFLNWFVETVSAMPRASVPTRRGHRPLAAPRAARADASVALSSHLTTVPGTGHVPNGHDALGRPRSSGERVKLLRERREDVCAVLGDDEQVLDPD